MKKKILFLLCCMILPLSLRAEPFPLQNCRILIASPIKQKPAILNEFLGSLDRLVSDQYTLDYFFVDDNDDEKSQLLLKSFAQKHANKCVISSVESIENNYHDHTWTYSLIARVAGFKNQIIEYARNHEYDYLFFIDSDIVLHPQTLNQLISTKKDIISNIFWTMWNSSSEFLPQVWMKDQYTQYEFNEGETLSEKEILQKKISFLVKMRTPGTYEVGGLGACTLISKKALSKEINFNKIKNISFWGEDRHFCIRAAALGLNLFVDTHYPAYHIYKESYLSDVERFKRSCEIVKDPLKQRITLSMCIKNEADSYLRQVLEAAKTYITDALIIDDASTDNSVAICEEILADIPHTIIKNKPSADNEYMRRKQQWEETIKTNPDWIVFLDADEIFEKSFAQGIHNLIKLPWDVYYFRLYDFWGENTFREDTYWQAHKVFSSFLVRYRSDVPYVWDNQAMIHCPRVPSNIGALLGAQSSFRLKHYGWANLDLRKKKYERYTLLDPDGQYGIKEQYATILDENPNLITWIE